MKRYLQLTITKPFSSSFEEKLAKVSIECATINIDLATNKVTLPGGFVCTLDSLARAVYQAATARRLWVRK